LRKYGFLWYISFGRKWVFKDTIVGVSLKIGHMDEQGDLQDMEKPFLAAAFATVFGALAGTTTAGAYIESATGIEEGGRTGRTAVVIASFSP
jgi:AGZA family xanthine/uracil permease-like MFS transporter